MLRFFVNTNAFFVSFLLLIFQNSLAQNQKKADSIILILNKKELTKKERVKYLISLSFHHSDIDTALLLAKQSLQIAKELNDKTIEARAWEEISHNERKLGNNDKSFNASFQALKIYESLEQLDKRAATYTQLANNYINDKDYDIAISYLKKSHIYYVSSRDSIRHALTLLNLGEAYRLNNYLDSAEISFKETLRLNKRLNNNTLQGFSQGNLGMVYNAQDYLNLAKTHLKEAVSILKKLGDSYAASVYLAELGDVHQKENQAKAAEENYLEALTMAQEAGLKEQIRDFSEKLTLFYENQGNYTKALAYQKLFQVYQDSLVNKANIQEIERLKAGYEIDKRESEIGLLTQANTSQKYFLWALGGGIFATLAFLWVLHKGNRRIKKANTTLAVQKAEISEREQEKALLLRELNHRVKNNLQMIASLLNLQSHELQGHPAKAALEEGKDRVEALSLVHRKLYQEGAETRIGLKEYLEELVLGLFHGYHADFEPQLEVADVDVSVDTAIPLALIVNELVVNALKYAFTGIKKPALLVSLKKTEDRLVLDVRDNGQGFAVKKAGQPRSFGLKLMDSLVAQLEGSIERSNGQGTHWRIQLPLETRAMPMEPSQEPIEKQFNRFHRRTRTKQTKIERNTP